MDEYTEVEKYKDTDPLYWGQHAISDHPVVRYDNDSRLFYKPVPFAVWISSQISLDELRTAYLEGKILTVEYMQFYRDKGYSLCGFDEIFHDEIDELTKDI